MFQADLAFAVELIAISIGVAFIIWSYRNEGAGILAAKYLGYFVLILGAISIICTTYYSIKYLSLGYFDKPIKMQYMKQHKLNHMDHMNP
tara:strand:+ start:11426 stop:11695 length:270 start_codon:yes stop_codon:yes gene_type:complete